MSILKTNSMVDVDTNCFQECHMALKDWSLYVSISNVLFYKSAMIWHRQRLCILA